MYEHVRCTGKIIIVYIGKTSTFADKTGLTATHIHLSLFQIVEGLRYAFPRRMKRFERKIPGLVALHDRVARRPRIAAYLASPRRIPFSQWGIYRYFKELDA